MGKVRQMTLKQKLFLGYGLMTALTLTTGITGIVLFNSLTNTMQHMDSVSALRLSLAADIRLKSERLFSLERSVVILTEHKNLDLAAQATESYENETAAIQGITRQLRQLPSAEADKKMLDDLDALDDIQLIVQVGVEQ